MWTFFMLALGFCLGNIFQCIIRIGDKERDIKTLELIALLRNEARLRPLTEIEQGVMNLWSKTNALKTENELLRKENEELEKKLEKTNKKT